MHNPRCLYSVTTCSRPIGFVWYMRLRNSRVAYENARFVTNYGELLWSYETGVDGFDHEISSPEC